MSDNDSKTGRPSGSGKPPGSGTPLAPSARDRREERLAQALRANLKRRKAQVRGRKASEPATSAPDTLPPDIPEPEEP